MALRDWDSFQAGIESYERSVKKAMEHFELELHRKNLPHAAAGVEGVINILVDIGKKLRKDPRWKAN